VLASAEGLSSVYWRVGSLCLVTDLHIHLGDLAQAGALIDQALAQCQGREVNHHWPQVMWRRAWLDLLGGDPALALSRLDALVAGEALRPEDEAALARVRAQALLAQGRHDAALACLSGFDGAPTQEVWILMLALRLRARSMLGLLDTADLARAEAELLDRRTPALESLALRQALIDGLHRRGDSPGAARQRALLQAQLLQLHDELGTLPDQQRAFAAAWALMPAA
jgi:hypothetical protein